MNVNLEHVCCAAMSYCGCYFLFDTDIDVSCHHVVAAAAFNALVCTLITKIL